MASDNIEIKFNVDTAEIDKAIDKIRSLQTKTMFHSFDFWAFTVSVFAAGLVIGAIFLK